MTAREFADLASGIASLAIALAAVALVVILVLRFLDEIRERRRRDEVGAPPLHRDGEP